MKTEYKYNVRLTEPTKEEYLRARYVVRQIILVHLKKILKRRRESVDKRTQKIWFNKDLNSLCLSLKTYKF